MSNKRLKIDIAAELILRQPQAKNEDIARQVPCTPQTVSSARRKLRKDGLLGPANNDFTSAEATKSPVTTPLPPLPAPDGAPGRGEEPSRTPQSSLELPGSVRMALGLSPEEIEAQIEPMTDEEAILHLSKLARQASRDGNAQLAASILGTFLRLKSKDDGTHRLGPGEPLTTEDKIDRLAVLIEGCGPDITAAACVKAGLGTILDEQLVTTLAPPPESADTPTASSAAADSPVEEPTPSEPDDALPPSA